jgi:cell division protein FtsN
MRINKTPWAILGAVLLAISACSRQQSDWQKTREANTTDSYELFIKKYPSGEFTAQAQARLKDLYEERDWQKARDADTQDAYQAFIKQYPEGKWTEEARIRVENFTLAQAPQAGGANPSAASAPSATAPAPAAGGPAMSAPSGPGPGAGTEASSQGTEPQSPPGTTSAPQRAPLKAHNHASEKEPVAAKAASGKFAVQLGAFKSGTDAANKRWERLQKQYPKLLAGLSSKVVPKKVTGGTLYRLQAFGMSEAHAERICKDLKAKSQPCMVIRPAHA